MAQQTTCYNTRGSCPVPPLIVAGCMLRDVCCTLCVVCDPALSRRRATTSGSCTAGSATPTRPSSTSRVIWPSPRARSAPTTRRQPAAACRSTASPPPHGRPQRSSEACVAPPDCCGRANAAQAARPSGYQGNLWYSRVTHGVFMALTALTRSGTRLSGTLAHERAASRCATRAR